MSKVVRMHRLGGPEVLQFEDIEVGAPGAGEVRLAMEAIGLNRSESDVSRRAAIRSVPKLPRSSAMKALASLKRWAPGVQGFKIGRTRLRRAELPAG